MSSSMKEHTCHYGMRIQKSNGYFFLIKIMRIRKFSVTDNRVFKNKNVCTNVIGKRDQYIYFTFIQEFKTALIRNNLKFFFAK